MPLKKKWGCLMYLHLGLGYSVRTKDVIAIFDYGLLAEAKGRSKVISCLEEGENSARSFIVTDQAIYISAVSPLTLRKRAAGMAEAASDTI